MADRPFRVGDRVLAWTTGDPLDGPPSCPSVVVSVRPGNHGPGTQSVRVRAGTGAEHTWDAPDTKSIRHAAPRTPVHITALGMELQPIDSHEEGVEAWSGHVLDPIGGHALRGRVERTMDDVGEGAKGGELWSVRLERGPVSVTSDMHVDWSIGDVYEHLMDTARLEAPRLWASARRVEIAHEAAQREEAERHARGGEDTGI